MRVLRQEFYRSEVQSAFLFIDVQTNGLSRTEGQGALARRPVTRLPVRTGFAPSLASHPSGAAAGTDAGLMKPEQLTDAKGGAALASAWIDAVGRLKVPADILGRPEHEVESEFRAHCRPAVRRRG
jgi:hypothetical protein